MTNYQKWHPTGSRRVHRLGNEHPSKGASSRLAETKATGLQKRDFLEPEKKKKQLLTWCLQHERRKN